MGKGRKRCFYYKCDTYDWTADLMRRGIYMYTIPTAKRSIQRQREFLVRMNIAASQYRIPDLVTVRICSKHFKESDLQETLKRKKLVDTALPIDWKTLYPKEIVELVEDRTGFRDGDDILEFIKEHRAYKDGQPRIEHDYAKELQANLLPSYVTRTEVELVRYVRTSQTVKQDGLLLTNIDYPVHTHNVDMEEAGPSSHVDEDQHDYDTGADWGGDNSWNEDTFIPKERVCRTCGEEEQQMIGIFDDYGRTTSLADKINSTLPINVSETDELPLQVCLACIEKIDIACKLVRKVRDIDSSLKKRYNVTDKTDALKSIMDDVGIGSCDGDDFETGADLREDSPEPTRMEAPNFNIEDLALELNPELDARAFDQALDTSFNPLHEPHYEQLLCSTCSLSFASVDEYVEHNERIHRRLLVYCPLCTVFFSSQTILRQHWRSLHSKVIRTMKLIPENAILQKLQKKRNTWTCKYCNDIYEDIDVYKKHLSEERRLARPPIPATFKCDYCEEMLTTESKKKHHMLSSHKEYAPYVCTYCGKKYKVKKCMRDHEESHRITEPSFLCTICGKVYACKAYLRCHMRTHLAHIPCTVCGKMFLPDRMRAHMKCHSNQVIECNECDRTFKCESALARHKFLHLGVRFPCKKCGFKARNPDKLREHNKMVHGVAHGTFKCAAEGCSDAFLTNTDLYKHSVRAHGTRKNIRPIEPGTDGFLCRECNATFATPEAYVPHYNKFHGETDKVPWTCSVCLSTPTNRYRMLVHLETHESCLRFSCEKCPQRFSASNRRCMHEFNKHQKPKKECPHCKKMVRTFAFDDHINLHTGNKPHKCSTCGKAFASNKNWKLHITTHLEKDVYSCDLCEQTFRTRRQLAVHIRVHSSLKSYKCKECNFESISRITVRHHYRREHTEQEVIVEELPSMPNLEIYEGADVY